MAYDEELVERVRGVLATRHGVSEKRMLGGLTFLVGGHTCCGIVGDELMVRVGPLAYVAALARRHAREMDFTGRPLRGYVYVAREGLRTPHAVRAWVKRGGDVRTITSAEIAASPSTPRCMTQGCKGCALPTGH